MELVPPFRSLLHHFAFAFRFDGFSSFGQAASNVPGGDGRLYIQLHDQYNVVGGGTLGIGGGGFSQNIPALNTPLDHTGGVVDGLGFTDLLDSLPWKKLESSPL